MLRYVLQMTGDWAFGTALCHIIPTVFGVVVYASTLTLTVIAVDRFALIVIGVKRRLSPTVAIVLVLVIAAFSTVVALPIAIFSRHVSFTDPELQLSRRSCGEHWPSLQIRRLYTVVTLIFNTLNTSDEHPLNTLSERVSRVLRPAPRHSGHLGDDTFQAITCAGTDW